MEKKNPLAKIVSFFWAHKRMPSYSEIAGLFNYKSKRAAYKLAAKLIDHGFIKKDKSGYLLPTGYFNEVKRLGIVEAGFPSPAEEELSETMSLDEWLIGNREATYLLKVSGDSMIEAGIMPGDTVLVERGADFKDGTIVVAQVDRGWTMKIYRKKGKTVYLEPANKKYKPIFPKQELVIAAVVKAVIRKY